MEKGDRIPTQPSSCHTSFYVSTLDDGRISWSKLMACAPPFTYFHVYAMSPSLT
ncbi:MAG: hypothetical protein J5846_00950 [Desulfovibrio sp.]|nr:hypothetical protein [Desulfovibrio sp.]